MKKILVVDDEPHIRTLLEQLLEELEEFADIEVAKDGVQGLDLAIEVEPDLIFLDIMMPRMNGYEVCAQIRDRNHPNPPHIILLSAKGQMIDRAQGLAVGADEYITKPFDPDMILSRVEEVLGIHD
jgi:CheY-like chemotaxis protein